ncbi:hypothetical protein GQ600_13967 [Phytophthora cactorum]|nr:hypothetical protein GQ600_13967 [Phytophthora cactorum]
MGPKKEKKPKKAKEKKGGLISAALSTPVVTLTIFLLGGRRWRGEWRCAQCRRAGQAFQSANRSLQMQLAERHEITVKTLESKRELQERVADLQKDFERERKETFG